MVGKGPGARLVLQEEEDPVVGDHAHFLLKALGGADLALKFDFGIASAVEVGAVGQPGVTRGFGPVQGDRGAWSLALWVKLQWPPWAASGAIPSQAPGSYLAQGFSVAVSRWKVWWKL